MLVGLFGCRRKPSAMLPVSATEEAAPKPPTVSVPGPVPAPSAPKSEKLSEDRFATAPPDSSLRFPIQQELTGAIHLYLMDYQKMPADFETLVKGKYLKAMPKPPPGKRFALDRNRMQVVILD